MLKNVAKKLKEIFNPTPKYELVENDTIQQKYASGYRADDNSVKVLHRIRALKNFGDVKTGDLGGYIESEGSLSQRGKCWVASGIAIVGTHRISGDIVVADKKDLYLLFRSGHSIKNGEARFVDLPAPVTDVAKAERQVGDKREDGPILGGIAPEHK